MGLGEQKTAWIDVDGPNAETDKAELFDTEAGQLWIPKSQIGARKGNAKTGYTKIEVTQWWAKQHGLYDEKDLW